MCAPSPLLLVVVRGYFPFSAADQLQLFGPLVLLIKHCSRTSIGTCSISRCRPAIYLVITCKQPLRHMKIPLTTRFFPTTQHNTTSPTPLLPVWPLSRGGICLHVRHGTGAGLLLGARTRPASGSPDQRFRQLLGSREQVTGDTRTSPRTGPKK